VLHILLRALQATLRKACPTAPRTAAMGTVSFLHRFASSLNPHFRCHLCVVDGLFEGVGEDADQDPADPAGRTALRLSALEFLDRLTTILPPPRIHRHRYHGGFSPNGGEAEETAQEFFPDDLDQTPSCDPAEPPLIPEDDFDQSTRAGTPDPSGPSAPPEAHPETHSPPTPHPRFHPTCLPCPSSPPPTDSPSGLRGS
jgi:hypothetical protein